MMSQNGEESTKFKCWS